jgi:hypothetical protein
MEGDLKSIQSKTALALLFTVGAIVLFLGSALLAGPVLQLYRGVTSLRTIHSVTQIVAFLAAGVLFLTFIALAVPVALQPARGWRKLLYVFPIFALGLALAGIFFTLTGIGSGIFATGWLVAGAVLSTLALLVVAFRAHLTERTIRMVLMGIAASAALSLLGWLGTLATVVLVATNQPTLTRFGGGQGEGGGPAGGQPGRPPGGFPGGPEGPRGGGFGPQSLTPVLIVAFVLLTIFAVLMVITSLRAWRVMRTTPAGELPVAPFHAGEIGSALVALIGLIVLFLAVIQLVPVSRTNPPVQTQVKWDSPQTADLARRACMDCHSNETVWPWYASFAPGSWLLASHVSSGRAQFNLSDLNSLPAFRKSNLAEEASRQIQNGVMPPSDYLMMHPEARLTDAEKAQLIQGFQKSLAQ